MGLELGSIWTMIERNNLGCGLFTWHLPGEKCSSMAIVLSDSELGTSLEQSSRLLMDLAELPPPVTIFYH